MKVTFKDGSDGQIVHSDDLPFVPEKDQMVEVGGDMYRVFAVYHKFVSTGRGGQTSYEAEIQMVKLKY